VDAQRQRNWLEVPWFFAENYFYRRIVALTGYFGEGPGQGQDPFAPHKEESLEASWQAAGQLARRVQRLRAQDWKLEMLPRFLSTSLWGNQGDLSMWPGGASEGPQHEDAESADAHVLVDEREAVMAYVTRRGGRLEQVDFLMDNAAFELVGDLALVLYLLESRLVGRVILHLKPHPVFVSDALPEDVRNTLRTLVESDDDAVADLGERLRNLIAHGRIQMRQHFFWTSPLAGWQMPGSLRATLARSDLVISKGDANYRRLLGDRHWPYNAPFAQIVSYFPASLLALRTLKSEVAAGIPAARIAAANAQDASWTTSGKWGVIQFALRSPAPQRS
jgi:uncharacterized protein with ATP-grasp and redox domains